LRDQNKEVVGRAQDQAQYLLVTVVEPMKEKDETVSREGTTEVLQLSD